MERRNVVKGAAAASGFLCRMWKSVRCSLSRRRIYGITRRCVEVRWPVTGEGGSVRVGRSLANCTLRGTGRLLSCGDEAGGGSGGEAAEGV